MYCFSCVDRVTKQQVAGVSDTSKFNIPSESTVTDDSAADGEVDMNRVSIADRSSNFKSNTNSSASTCEVCDSKVFKAEEVICMGKCFHKVTNNTDIQFMTPTFCCNTAV